MLSRGLARSVFLVALAGGLASAQTITPLPCSQESSLYSSSANTGTSITFLNSTLETVQVFWLDYSGIRQPYGVIAPGTSYTQGTFVTNPWVAANATTGACLEIFEPLATPATAVITGGIGAISSGSLPNATVGIPYLAALAAAGGTPPYYNWRIVTGALPQGLSLNPASGSIGGTPDSATGRPFSF